MIPPAATEVTQSDHGRPSILFLSQCLPYPPFSGVTRRTFHILEQLSRTFEVTLLAFYRQNHQANAADVQKARTALAGIVSEVLDPVAVSSERSFARRLLTHLFSLLTHRPYTYYEYGGSRFERTLRSQVLKHGPDLVHLDSMDLYRWIRSLPSEEPITCTHHSVESELLRLRAARVKSAVIRAYINWQANRVEEVERKWAPRVSLNLMMSDLDAIRLQELAPGARTTVVPNGVDVKQFQASPARSSPNKTVLFMGPLYMYPNWDAVDFFVRESWPLVRREHPEADLLLIGKHSSSQAEALAAVPGVRPLGFVPDVRPHLSDAHCCIAPLRIGGGTRLKILEYWAMARAVVSTSVGCEGLDVEDGINALVRDDPSSLAEAVVQVLADQDLAASLGRAGRATVETTYSWDSIGLDLRNAYLGLLAKTD